MGPPYVQQDTGSQRLHNPGPVLTFGILQVIFGVGLIVSDIVSFVIALDYAFIFTAGASGMWTGILFIITGSFGIASGKPLSHGTHPSSRKCALVTSMVLSILSTLAAFCMLSTFITFLVLTEVGIWDFGCFGQGPYCPFGAWVRDIGNGLMSANLAFHVILFVASLGQSIAAGINMCKLRSPGSTVQYVFTQQPPASPGFYPGGPAVVYNMPYMQPGVYTVPSQSPLYGVQTLNPAHLQVPQKS